MATRKFTIVGPAVCLNDDGSVVYSDADGEPEMRVVEESFEVRPLNTRALVLHEKSLLKQNIEKGSNEAGVELCRVLLLSWERDGKDMMRLSERKMRDELASHDAFMVRIIQEAKAVADKISKRYETDAKN